MEDTPASLMVVGVTAYGGGFCAFRYAVGGFARLLMALVSLLLLVVVACGVRVWLVSMSVAV